MFNIIKRENKEKLNDEYELTKSVKITDVKGYLQKEYDRAEEREATIKKYENQIMELKQTEIKYDALLVVQERTQKRIEKQDSEIENYRSKIEELTNNEKLLRSQIVDIKINAENKLKEKDNEIERKDNIIDELEKIFKDYGAKEDIVGYCMYYISGETIINILDKLKGLKENK